MTLIIGITGNIASGKSYIAHMCKDINICIVNSDQIVHYLLEHDQEIFVRIKHHIPYAIVNDKIDRNILSDIVFNNTDSIFFLEKLLYKKIEYIRHNLIKDSYFKSLEFIILDIPLLFEKKLQYLCDYIITITTPGYLQIKRLITRNMMSNSKYGYIKALQFNNDRKAFNSYFNIRNNLYPRSHFMYILDQIRLENIYY